MRSASKKGRKGSRRRGTSSGGRKKPCGCPPGSRRVSTKPRRGGGKARGSGFVCVETVPAEFHHGKKRATRFVKPKRSC